MRLGASFSYGARDADTSPRFPAAQLLATLSGPFCRQTGRVGADRWRAGRGVPGGGTSPDACSVSNARHHPTSIGPFPSPQRAQGHAYRGEVFPAEKHYADNRVAIFVPPGFQPDAPLNFVVHFHGWRARLDQLLPKFRLLEQFVAIGKNVLLEVPQGPLEAPDSFGGARTSLSADRSPSPPLSRPSNGNRITTFGLASRHSDRHKITIE